MKIRISYSPSRAKLLQTELLQTVVEADTGRMGMVLRFAVVAAVIAGALGLVQQKHVLQNAGLFGSCSHVATPAGQTGVWHECVPGKLTGTPSLSRGSCTRVQHSPSRDFWRCPTALESNTIRQ